MSTSVPDEAPIPVYDLSINVRTAWYAHSLSNAGTDGSIRLLPRRQLLADGTATDACSGNIAKHYHAVLLAEYFEGAGVALCAACRTRDGRRAAALAERNGDRRMTIDSILVNCGLCDAHGFLITARHGMAAGRGEARQRIAKHSLIEFSYALALPDRQAESVQVATRGGGSKEGGQMLMKMPARSGEYALCVRYRGVGVGADTDSWRLVVDDAGERRTRHRAILAALRDALLSPQGAMTATMLPHLIGLSGAVVVRTTAGRAPLYSPLVDGFVAHLTSLAAPSCAVYPFATVVEFQAVMDTLIETSFPCLPATGTGQMPPVHEVGGRDRRT